MEEMLKTLGLDYLEGQYGKQNTYVIDLGSDREFGKVYTILDNAYGVDQEEESVLLTVHNSQIIYNYMDEYQLVLKADFDHELYSLIISEIK